MKAFKAPKESIGDVDAGTAATLISTAADIALVLDGNGVIQDVACQQTDLSMELAGYGKWFGRAWEETVTAESQPKVESLLREASTKKRSVWRQLNHQTSRGQDIPVLYAAVQLGRGDRFVALGRELRAVATLQQKLIEAQMSMERDYARLRHAETRYRLLFQLSSEPMLVVEAANQKVVEANPAATTLFDAGARRVIGKDFAASFDADSAQRISTMISEIRSTGRSESVRVRLTNGNQEFLVSATQLRQDANALILIRLLLPHGAPAAVLEAKSKLLALARGLPDGLVVTDRDGRVMSANASFLAMAQLPSEEQAQGESLDRWFGRPGVDLHVLLANLRQNETVRLFATTLNGELGAPTDIEVSAVPLTDRGDPLYGFAIRDVGRRLSPATGPGREMPRSPDQITELIGRVPLKDIVRETTDVVERLCIEAALDLTSDNRASASEMLGLSRQSLYVKLRRFGLIDASEAETEDE